MRFKLILILVVTFFCFSVSAQKMTKAKLRVVDSESKEGIELADILIQELMIVEKTAQFGIAVFEKVPIRQVTVEVNKTGYIPTKEEINMTENEWDNNFSISLIKERKNVVVIYGTIRSGGMAIPKCKIKMKIGDYKDFKESDEFGDYYFYVPQDKIKAKIEISVITADKKEKETEVQINQTDTYKEVDIEFESECGSQKESKNGIYVELCECRKEKRSITCTLQVVNRNPSLPTIDKTACGDRSQISYEGQQFKIQQLLIKDKVIKYPCKHYDLVYNEPIKMEAEFFVGDVKMDKISLLKFYSFGILCEFINVPLK